MKKIVGKFIVFSAGSAMLLGGFLGNKVGIAFFLPATLILGATLTIISEVRKKA